MATFVLQHYLDKHRFCHSQIEERPSDELKMIVTIPSFDEPDLITTLDSLWLCERIAWVVEVLIIVNASENSPKDLIERSRHTIIETNKWIKDHADKQLRFHILENLTLPAKHAGVGLARKIVMDEAVARFLAINNETGLIICLDADCIVDKNYLKAIHEYFLNNPDTIAGHVYFEHPLEGHEDAETYKAIIDYELYLRYYIQALRYCGFPYFYHTIGSCMIFRAGTYARQGGMNRRKAGEDFYMLHKVIPLGNFGEINDTTVRPSPRPSTRVPFGTGITITKWLKDKPDHYPAYNPAIFDDLKKFFHKVPDFFKAESNEHQQRMPELPKPVQDYLISQDFVTKILEINMNSSSKDAFIKRFYNWFNGFRVLKFVHFAEQNFYGPVPVGIAAEELLKKCGVIKGEKAYSVKELLFQFRAIDKNGGFGWV